MKYRLTKWDKNLLKLIGRGSDITGYKEAVRLRELQKQGCNLFQITPVVGAYGAKEQRPYFGCMLTPKGHKAVGKSPQSRAV